MADKAQLKKLAISRLRAAKILLNKGDPDGAYYIAGYVLELALKAVICKNLNLPNYPDTGNKTTPRDVSEIFRTHNHDILLTLSGLASELSLSNAPTRLFENWSELTAWKPGERYEPVGSHNPAQVQRMIDALEEKPYGVLIWIRSKRKW